GLYLDPDSAVARGLELVEQGADIVDVGGESTRPGAEPVAEEEELRRVLPVIERLVAEGPDARISVDTTKAAVARAALQRRDEIVALGRPVVVGSSRKSFLGKLTGGRDTGERLAGTLATSVLAFERGASVFRVHDVAEVRDALRVAAATVTGTS